MRYFKTIICCLCLSCFGLAYGQNESDEQALLNVKDGISISKDSVFLLNLRFRMQNRFGWNTVNAYNLNFNTFDARVRRLRLRFDGFLMTKKMRYYLQLSFSKADQELETSDIPHTVRDAILYYHFTKNFYVGFGQSKLPGNRERVVSSGNLQFPDRSIANSAMTLERDFGFFFYYTLPVGHSLFNLKTSLTSGDGRNASPINDGLAYTGRLEWLPFGDFLNNGDYSEGDLEFEPKPKLSLAGGYSFNNKAARTGGTLGLPLYDYRNMLTFISDLMFKYKGVAVLAEYFERSSGNPVTMDTASGAVRYIYAGRGLNVNMSKMITRKWEIAARYTKIIPFRSITAYEKPTEEILLGVNKYLKGHRIKLQGTLGYRWKQREMELNKNNYWSAMFQVEFGI